MPRKPLEDNGATAAVAFDPRATMDDPDLPASTGRPRIIATPEEFEAKAEQYFQQCQQAEEPPLLTGLVLFLGYADIASLDDLGRKRGPRFSVAVKRAKTRVAAHHEKRLSTEAKPTGSIFWLKARDDWRDQFVEVRGAIAHVDLTQLPPDLLARIAGGEHPLSVLASAADALALGPGVEVGEGEAPAGEDSAHIEDGGDGTDG